MKRTIACILALMTAMLCCAAAQAASEKLLVSGDGVELWITEIQMNVENTSYPQIVLKLRGVNSADRNLYITFEDTKIDGKKVSNWYAQGLEPYQEGPLVCYVDLTEETKHGRKLEMLVDIVNTHDYKQVLSETVTVDLPQGKEEKPTVNIPVFSGTSSASTKTSTSTGSYNDVSPGKTITFGHYEQDGNVSNGSEAIDWLVLEVSGSKAFVVCNCGLFNAKYTEHSKGQQWENCDLRATLNSSFYYEAFSPDERDAIQLTCVDNSEAQGDPSAVSYRGYGDDTYDYIYVLSYGELVRYLPTANDRVVQICQKFKNKGLGSPEYVLGMRTCNYWLRHPVYNQNAGAVTWSGGIESAYMNFSSCMVRPCCWVDVSALGY